MSENVTDTITIRQRKAITCLLFHTNVFQAAKEAGVSRQTLYRWMNTDKAFQDALYKAESEALTDLSRTLVTLGSKAAQTLEETLSEREAAVGIKVRAADIILNRLLQLRELVSLESRVSALEVEANKKASTQ